MESIKLAPKIAINGKRIGIKMGERSESLLAWRWILGMLSRGKLSLFVKQTIIEKMIIKRVKKITRGTVCKGFVIPKKGLMVFNNKPENIKKEILNPIDNRNILRGFNSLSLIKARINNPGKMIKHKNTKTCLTNGKSKNIAMSVRRSNPDKIMNSCNRFILS